MTIMLTYKGYTSNSSHTRVFTSHVDLWTFLSLMLIADGDIISLNFAS